MSIFPLPVFESDADPATREAMTDQEIYDRLEPPSTIVVRYGAMLLVAEYPYNGDAKPGCGSKLVARTNRGTEVVEMLTSTCPNAGCGKSVSRKEMLEYIENSGGRDYPFRRDGRILRIASIDDLNRWSAIQAKARERLRPIRDRAIELGLTEMKVIEIEPVLSEEMLTVYYMAEDRIDFRELVRSLAGEFECRIEMKQVGARDEARLTADYERCGQHCCCKNFLKVLKPVSMRSAKTQKATLDPLKISGRCGRLMCCLRYEDETYSELKRRLPTRKSRVGTPMGPGIVLDTKILVQLALIRLESDGTEMAFPVEELCDPDNCPAPTESSTEDPLRGLSVEETERRTSSLDRKHGVQDAAHERAETEEASPTKPRRRRRRGRGGRKGDDAADAALLRNPARRPKHLTIRLRPRKRRRDVGGDVGAAVATAPVHRLVPPTESGVDRAAFGCQGGFVHRFGHRWMRVDR